MKKSFLSKLLILLICTFTLSSCALLEIIDQAIGTALSEDDSQVKTSNYSNYSLDNKILGGTNLVHDEGKAGKNISIAELKNNEGYQVFPSTGNKNLLVIPVYFSDYKPEDCFSESREEARNNIYKTFFGESNDSESSNRTGWESVSSFYKKSSYGNLNISGMVTDWYAYPSTLKKVVTTPSFLDPSTTILRNAVDWFKKTYPDRINDYDLDNDGYIDGIVLIYANSYGSSDRRNSYYNGYASGETLDAINSLCWAYVTWDVGMSAEKKSPNANVYMFASYKFMWEGEYYPLVDAHTYIHEFGHMLGLDDYYSYDDDNTQPLGRLDMMDYNIGDHDAYSKYLLGWVEPTLVTEEGTYSISSLAESSSALLIPASLNDFSYSAFDEYLLLEFYTPTGNNYMDSTNKYGGFMSQYPYLYSNYAIKILHVDSRIIMLNDKTGTYNYIKSLDVFTSNKFNKSIAIGASNTPSSSINPNFKLISLVSQRGIKNYFSGSIYNASNSDLYNQGQSLNEFTFNNGKSLEYTIKVSSISENGEPATIQISKK